MSNLRFAGQEGSLLLLDSTTGDQLVADIRILSWKWEPMFELTENEFIGELAPDFREFGKGYQLDIETQPAVAAQQVAFINLLMGKAQATNMDEIAAGLKYVSPDNGSFRITCRDLHIASAPHDMPKRSDFLKTSFSFKGKVFKCENV